MVNTKGIKHGGRQKGTPNKITSELRDLPKQLIDWELNSLSKRHYELKPNDRVELLVKLFPYLMPKV